MKKTTILSFFIFVCFLFTTSLVRAAISVGDIAVIGWNSDPAVSTKDFVVVALAAIPSGETIFFTDKGRSLGGWQADLATEGIFSLTTTSTVAAGTVIRFSVTSGITPSVSSSPSIGTLTVTNGWTSTSTAAPFGGNGDQVIIFQGSLGSPVFIYAFNSGINITGLINGWNTGGSIANNYSEIPAGLTNATNAVSHAGAGAFNNYVYTGTRSGSKATLLAGISNASNWGSDDINPYDLSPGGTQFPGLNPIFILSGTLPVQLISFTGVLQNNSIVCEWVVDHAVNFERFILEKSLNGGAFTSIGIVPFSAQREKYQFTDTWTTIATAPVYYRLKMVDIDGTWSYSKTIAVKSIENNSQFEIVNLGPNPFRDELHLGIYLKENQIVHISLLDAAGKVLRSERCALGKGFSTKSFKAPGTLKPGIYFLQVEAGNLIISRKLVREE